MLMFTPGPTEVHPRVLQAMARPLQNPDLDPDFYSFYDALCEKVKKIMKTGNDVILHSGEAIIGLEAAVASLVSPDEKVLTIASGIYGEGFANFVQMYGGKPVIVKFPYDEIVKPEEVERALEKEKDIEVATMVHCETPSGTLNPLREIGKICNDYGIILIVDAVSSVAGVPVETDKWHIDINIVGSQKCISAPPGVGIISVSEKAWEKMEKRDQKSKIKSFYLNLLSWKRDWFQNRIFPYTHTASLLYALDEACQIILEEKIEKVYERHQKVAKGIRQAVKAMGLELYPKEESYCSDTVTAIKIPKGIEDEKLRNHILQKYGVMIAGNWGELRGKVIRLGHMGYNAYPHKAINAIFALSESLKDLGFKTHTEDAVKTIKEHL
ncbi:MAG: alanine--glyoxylate aminotransferase family protein [Candidatus Jordarchaeaceae archaeon]